MSTRKARDCGGSGWVEKGQTKSGTHPRGNFHRGSTGNAEKQWFVKSPTLAFGESSHCRCDGKHSVSEGRKTTRANGVAVGEEQSITASQSGGSLGGQDVLCTNRLEKY